MTTRNSRTTGQTRRIASRRTAQELRSPGGPASGSRQVIHATARHRSTVATMPGEKTAREKLPEVGLGHNALDPQDNRGGNQETEPAAGAHGPGAEASL